MAKAEGYRERGAPNSRDGNRPTRQRISASIRICEVAGTGPAAILYGADRVAAGRRNRTDGPLAAAHSERFSPIPGWLRLCGAVLVLHMALVLPDRADRIGLDALLRLPVELPLVALLLLLPPTRWRRPLALGLAAGLSLLSLLRLADMAAFAAFARPASLPADLPLAAAGWDLVSAALGVPAALGMVAIAVLGLAATTAALGWSASTLAQARLPRGGRRALGGLTLAAILGAAGWPAGVPDILTAQASRIASGHAARMFAQIGNDNRPDRAVPDAFAAVPDDRLLAALNGTDVLIVFVESYGRSTLEDPRYATGTADTLRAFEAAAAKAGFAARSAWLTSSVFGGQSWLAHASLLSGQWIETPADYRRLLASDTPTLIGDFGRAGWRRVAVKPGITADWPEGRFYGYDRIHAAADLSYAGAPFNWITMPDQYTLAEFARRELAPAGRPPVLAELSLISSHAPWTPVPPLLPWDAVGDGRVYTPYAEAGPSPEAVWRDPDRVQAQYAASIDYTLRSLSAFVAAHGRKDMLILVLGDHQPPPVVSGDTPSHDVPVHVLAGNPALLDALEDWNWTPGLRPDAHSPVWRMDALRARLLEAFTPEEDAVAAVPAVPPS